MKFLIIGDPIEGLLPKSDTGLTIVRACLARGHDLFWATPEQVALSSVCVEANTRAIVACRAGSLPETSGTQAVQRIDSFDAVWIRKDPPMDWKYISLCWILSMEEGGTVIVNRPSLLLEYHEKMVPFRALRAGFLRDDEVISTHLLTGPRSRLPEQTDDSEWISKPWLGHGGRGVTKWDSLARFRADAFREVEKGESYLMLQRFLPEIHRTGDRRLFYIAGAYAGGFTRIPAPGGIKANLASGGTAVRQEMTAQQLDVVERLGAYLRSIGVVLAGADMIDGKISEVNITAPTGFETYFELEGKQPIEQLVAFVEQLVRNRGAWPPSDVDSV